MTPLLGARMERAVSRGFRVLSLWAIYMWPLPVKTAGRVPAGLLGPEAWGLGGAKPGC